jgi:hypothetical protein
VLGRPPPTNLLFSLPSICQKKVTAAFDGGRLSSDAGVVLLAAAGKRFKVINEATSAMRR